MKLRLNFFLRHLPPLPFYLKIAESYPPIIKPFHASFNLNVNLCPISITHKNRTNLIICIPNVTSIPIVQKNPSSDDKEDFSQKKLSHIGNFFSP